MKNSLKIVEHIDGRSTAAGLGQASPRTGRLGLLALGAALVLPLLAGGCKDKAKCDEAVQTTRQALTVDDTALARQWRDRTWKMCGDKAQLATLDSEILAKEAELAKKATEDAAKARELAQSKVDELDRLWRGVDKLDAFQHEGKKLEKDKVGAEIKAAYTDGKRLIRGVEEPYAKQLLTYNSQNYKRRLAILEAKAASKISR